MIRVGPGVVLLLFWLAWALPSFAQVLEKTHSFEGPPPPPEELMQAADGAFYGTTSSGGPFHAGTLFKMNSMGPVNRLAAFNGTNGVQPNSRLIQDLDGNFYGTTYTGGSNNLGTVFRMTPAKVLSALHTFSAGHGAHPTGLFLQASDGSFYGVTADGCGDTNAPAIFKLTKAGDFTIVAIMDPEGQGAPTSLSQASDGNFYGTFLTRFYSLNNYPPPPNLGLRLPIFFRMSAEGAIANLVSFPNAEVKFGRSPVVQGRDGNFYGFYVNDSLGTQSIFKISRSGVISILATLNRGTNNFYAPASSMVQGSDGNFYFTTKNSSYTDAGGIMKLTPSGQLSVVHLFPLHDYQAGSLEFQNPGSPLVAGKDGSLYGTIYGGIYNNLSLFKMSMAGVLTKQGVMSTAGGYNPGAGLVEAADGSFYGTTTQGGLGAGGTVFKITAQGVFSTLASFMDTNGYLPSSRLTFGLDGNLYGTTKAGGSTNRGTIFRITPSGTLTRLAFFTQASGYGPVGGLLRGKDGNFYGLTTRGGARDWGTFFKVTPAGAITALFSFIPEYNPEYATTGLTLGMDGNFYGTTIGWDSTGYGLGSVYKLTPAGGYTKLAAFNGLYSSNPRKLFQASNGMFYGSASDEAYGTANIFSMTPAGLVTPLISLESTTVSSEAFVEGSDGYLYTQAISDMGKSEILKLSLDGKLMGITTFEYDEETNYGGQGLMLALNGDIYGTLGPVGNAGAPEGYWPDYGGGAIVRLRITPFLKVSRSGDQLIHSWSTNMAGLVLQSASSLDTGAVWTDSKVLPTRSGASYRITNMVSSGNRFYRLRK